MIELINIEKRYGSTNVLTNINLSVIKGDYIAIVGKSGSGKSTILNILGLLDRSSEGVYDFNNQNINEKSDYELSQMRNKQIGFVFQMYHLLPNLTVSKNILLPNIYCNEKYNKNIEDELITLLKRLDIYHLKDKKIQYLSGGEKQRVAIARSLIMNPSLVLCDEPTGNLDNENTKIILDVFNELNRKGKTIIIVTHNHQVANCANKVYRLMNGELHNEKKI